MNRFPFLTLAILVLESAMGCSTKPRMMPPPVAAPHPLIVDVAAGGSLKAAIDVARSMRKTGAAPVRILLHGGTYATSQPVELTAGDSGTTFEAAAGDKVVISGGQRIEGWRQAKLNGHDVWAADVPEVREGKWFFRELFVDGMRATRARQPNDGTFKIVRSPDAKPDPDWQMGQSRFVFDGKEVPPGPFPFGAEAVAMCRWIESRLPIKSVDEANHIVNLARHSHFRLEPGDPYWLEGDPRWLDEEQEWFLDRAGGTLYYLAPKGQDLTRAEVIAPRATQLIIMRGVKDVTFRGITFSHTEWMFPEVNPATAATTTQPADGGFDQAAVGVPAAVAVEGVSGCRFERCTFEHLGTYGLDLGRASQNNMVSRCTFRDLGAGGIKLGEGGIEPDPAKQSFGNEISDCEISGGGKLFPSAVGIWVGQSRDNLIAHNHVHDFWYTGISVGWTWGYGESLNRNNIIEHNLIHGIGRNKGEMPILSDMGGIYVLGARAGTTVRNNVIHDVAGVKYGGWGIYLDEGTSDTLITNNLVYRTLHGSFHQHYGKDNVVRNNIFAFAGEEQIVRSKEEQDHNSFTFERNIVYWRSGPLMKLPGRHMKFDHNLYGPISVFDFRAGKRTWDRWRELGMDEHTVFTMGDSPFVDAAAADFRLKPISMAQQIGFVPFDVADVGVRER